MHVFDEMWYRLLSNIAAASNGVAQYQYAIP
jgi:hypothetical protein